MKKITEYSCRFLLAGLCLLMGLAAGCTMNEHTPASTEAAFPVAFRISGKDLTGKMVDEIDDLRIMICKTTDGIFFFNEPYSADVFTGTIDLELYPGQYHILVVANDGIHEEILDREGVTMADLTGLMGSPSDYVSGSFPYSVCMKGVWIGNIMNSEAPEQVSIDGGATWREDIPVELERLFPKMNIALRKMTRDEKDRVRITSLQVSRIPLYSFLLPAVYDKDEFNTLQWYPHDDYPSSTNGYLTENNNADLSHPEDLYLSGTETYLRFGLRNVILPEYIPADPTDNEKALSLKITYDYESWNPATDNWNPPVENITADILLTGTEAGVQASGFLRNNEYNVLLTITQIAEFEFKPYVILEVAGWDQGGTGHFNAGNKDVSVQGHWTKGVPEMPGGLLYVDMNDYVEYEFTFHRENPQDKSFIRWKAVLSNPVDFCFAGGGVYEGNAPAGETCKIRVTPVRASRESNSTKLYINIENGVGGTLQLPLDPDHEYVVRQNPQ